MRFFAYTMGDPTVPLPPPSPELMQKMGVFVQEAMSSGVVIATGGLAPTSEGVEVRLHDGKFSITDGPFAEAKEVIGGWALLDTSSKEEAIEWSKKFLGVIGEGETRLRRVMEGPDD